MFEFLDVVEHNRKYPATFEIPSAEEIAQLKPGWMVKVAFATGHYRFAYERMWVILTSVNGEDLEGVLNNDPVVLRACDGDYITGMKTKNVLDILPVFTTKNDEQAS